MEGPTIVSEKFSSFYYSEEPEIDLLPSAIKLQRRFCEELKEIHLGAYEIYQHKFEPLGVIFENANQESSRTER